MADDAGRDAGPGSSSTRSTPRAIRAPTAARRRRRPPARAAPPRAGTGGGCRACGRRPPGARRSPACARPPPTSMMFMITIPPTPERHRGDQQGEDEGRGRDLPPELLQALGGDDAERIGGAEVGVAQRAQHARAPRRPRPRPRSRRRGPGSGCRASRGCRTAAGRPGSGRITVVVRLWPSVRPCLASEADHAVGRAADAGSRGRSGRGCGKSSSLTSQPITATACARARPRRPRSSGRPRGRGSSARRSWRWCRARGRRPGGGRRTSRPPVPWTWARDLLGLAEQLPRSRSKSSQVDVGPLQRVEELLAAADDPELGDHEDVGRELDELARGRTTLSPEITETTPTSVATPMMMPSRVRKLRRAWARMAPQRPRGASSASVIVSSRRPRRRVLFLGFSTRTASPGLERPQRLERAGDHASRRPRGRPPPRATARRAGRSCTGWKRALPSSMR